MKTLSLRNIILGLAMLAAAGLALALTPTHKLADQGPKLNLETMIPKQFGEWKLDETIAPLLADPKQTALPNQIYNQTLSRRYVNLRGDLRMHTS